MALQIVSSTSTTAKMLLIGVVVLVLLVPLTMLRNMVQERTHLREQAFEKVALGWGGPLTMGGPVLVIPTERSVVEGNVTRICRDNVVVLPDTLDVVADLRQEPEPRYVGIYPVPVYIASLKLRGTFTPAMTRRAIESRYPGLTWHWDQAQLRLPISEVRSLRKLTSASFAGEELAFSPVNDASLGGVEAIVHVDETSSASLTFNIELSVAGSREVSLLPLGGTTTVQLHSDWPHPSFQGAFLPVTRSITPQGFDASWQVLQLNRAYGQSWLESQVDAKALQASTFGVGLFQTVDVYQRAERAMKYALLFIALTFITFFAVEHLTRIRLHPLQYLFVGLALSIFYLLLLALSEQVSFAIAYWSAALALVALIGSYLAGALRKRQRGVAAAAAMTGVYGVLYALVLSENYALLMGAVVLFVALGAVMLVTRHVDWYASTAE